MPSNAEGQRLNLRIKFRSDNLDSFVERYGADVSSGGIFIRSKTPLDVGTKVSFTLALMDGTAVFVGEGTVAWARKPEADKPGGNPGMGIRFDMLSDDSRGKLTQILEMKLAHDKAGRPVLRGPTPIPEPDSGFSSRDATAKVRLTDDGRIVRDMPMVPAAPVPSASAPAPSQPYAASFSNPTGRASSPTPSDNDATQVTAPPTERVRRATPSLQNDAPQPFGPSKTATNTPPLRTGGGDVIRVTRPSVIPQPAASEGARARAATPAFGGQPGPKAPAPSPFASTMGFGEPTRMQGLGAKAAPTRQGTPAPDLLRRATPPPMPVAPAPSVFSRPTPVPGAPLNESRSGAARSGPVVARPSATRPAVVAPPAKGGWGEDKTEIVEDVPSFDDIEEKTTTVKGQALPPSGGFGAGFGNEAATRPGLATQPLPEGAVDEFAQFPDTPRPAFGAPTAGLGDLFEGEPLPGATDPGSLLDSAEAVAEFSRNDSSARGRRPTPTGPMVGTSMVARKVETTDVIEGKRRRGVLWAVLGLAAVGGAVYAFVEYGGFLPASRDRATLVEHPADVPPGGSEEAAPAQPEPAAPEPSAAAPEAVAPPPEAPAPEKAAPVAEKAAPVAEKAAPVAEKPAPVAEKPAPAAAKPPVPVRPAAPARPAPTPKAPRAEREAVAVPATPGEDGDENAIYWLRVRSVPAGADVSIDGDAEGQTPFQRRIFDPTRPYALSVRKEGYEPHERMISASDPWMKSHGEYQLTITVKLRKLPGAPAAEPAAAEEAPAPAAPSAPVLDP